MEEEIRFSVIAEPFYSGKKKEEDWWAKEQVELFNEQMEDEYIGNCADSALKAYNVLWQDGHSGMSIQITKNILNRLIDKRCLVAARDEEELWTRVHENLWQHRQMTSLFKRIGPDGKDEFKDVDRLSTIDEEGLSWHNSTVEHLIESYLPKIELPYFSDEKIKCYIRSFDWLGKEPGSYDTIHIKGIEYPDGTVTEINRYWFEDLKNPDEWIEKTEAEYKERLEEYNEYWRTVNDSIGNNPV